MVLLALLGILGSQAGTCEKTTTNADLKAALSNLETHLVQEGGPEVVDADVARLEVTLLCLGEVVRSSDAAQVHLLLGLARYTRFQRTGDHALESDAVLSFRACRGIFPGCRPPNYEAAGMSSNADLRILFEGQPPIISTAPIPPPSTGLPWFDGVQTLQKPVLVPTLYQYQPQAGQPVTVTRLLDPDESPPGFQAVKGRSLDPARPLGLASAGSLAVAAGLYTAALVTKGLYNHEEDEARRQELVSTNHRLVLSSAALGGAGVILGAGAAFAWRF